MRGGHVLGLFGRFPPCRKNKDAARMERPALFQFSWIVSVKAAQDLFTSSKAFSLAIT
jgi:hypothetical protein